MDLTMNIRTEHLVCPWDRVPEDAREALTHHARVRGEIAADGYYGSDERVLRRDAALYYTEIVNQAVERGELSPTDVLTWADELAQGATHRDPRILAFAEGFRARVEQWSVVRNLAGEEGVRTMIRTGHPAGAVMEDAEGEGEQGSADAEPSANSDSGDEVSSS